MTGEIWILLFSANIKYKFSYYSFQCLAAWFPDGQTGFLSSRVLCLLPDISVHLRWLKLRFWKLRGQELLTSCQLPETSVKELSVFLLCETILYLPSRYCTVKIHVTSAQTISSADDNKHFLSQTFPARLKEKNIHWEWGSPLTLFKFLLRKYIYIDTWNDALL